MSSIILIRSIKEVKKIRRLIITFIIVIISFTSFSAVSAGKVEHGPFENCTISTPNGDNVYITDNQRLVNLTFTNVLISGDTVIAKVNDSYVPNPSSNFNLTGCDSYYEIHTTAEFDGNITVSVNYAGTNYEDESTLRLWHYDSSIDGGTWVDCTYYIDTINKIIYGKVSSLSPFAVHIIADGSSFINNNPPIIPGGSNNNNPIFPGGSGTPIIPINPIIPTDPTDPGNSNGNTQTNNPVNTIISTAGESAVQSVTVNAASDTVEMQKTGLPLIGLILAILAVIGGLNGARRR